MKYNYFKEEIINKNWEGIFLLVECIATNTNLIYPDEIKMKNKHTYRIKKYDKNNKI